jgi:DNA polymerase III delta subunit
MAVKRYSELKASDWRTPATVYLLEGEEPVLQREFLAQLRRALQVEAGSIDESVLDARETPTTTVSATVQTVPMEAERRLVILSHANRYSPNELQALARLVEQVPPFACHGAAARARR